MKLRRFIASWLLLIPFVCMGQETDSLTLARQDSLAITESDDFVKASILVATPSDVLYSCVGHASIRMQCPYYDLDVVYTYESESVKSRILSFLMGELKMGMTSIPTERILSGFGSEGRGITEYPLNIPLDKRKSLWQYLDGKVEEGMNLPYDYLNRGCALSCFRAIRTALLPDTISFGEWDEKFVKQSRRTLASRQMDNFPWNRFILQMIIGTDIDQPCALVNKIIVPLHLIEVLEKATLNGQPLLGEMCILAHQTVQIKEPGWVSPMVISSIFFLLAIVSCFWWQRPLSILLLIVQSVIGLFMVYLVFFSKLPCSNFSWLLIPFNPLPLLLWHWRRWWLLPFGLVCCVWSIAMLLQIKNSLVDPAHIILVFALTVNYIGQWYQIRKTNQLKQIKR